MRLLLTLLLLFVALSSKADQGWGKVNATGGRTASAHVDFRVIIPETVSLSVKSLGWTLQGNTKVVVVEQVSATGSRLTIASP